MTFDAIPNRFRQRIVVDPSGCWLWQGYRQKKQGYGQLRFGRRIYLVHKFIFELLIGPVPDGFELHHKCEVKHCCNPEHLAVVTKLEHGLFSRRTHCPRGHELTPENVYQYKRYSRPGKPAPGRCCLICRREVCRKATQRWREKQKI